MADGQTSQVDILLEHIEKLLNAPALPAIPPEGEHNEKLCAIHEYLTTLRTILEAFAKGDLAGDITIRGVVAGRLKALQANLLHLTWQIQQVAEGDFSQRVEFMGEYAKAFNSMVEQLDTALTALRHKEEELTKLTKALQTEVAEKAEALAALSKSEARFKHLAEHDVLTGVLNRRSFYELAAKEFERAEKSNYPCSLALIDIDFFKKLNDTYGHLDGDAALRHLTQTLEASLRHGGTVGRYGGEEFVVLLPGLDIETAKKVAERLRKAIAKSPVMMHTGPVNMTVSIGLAHVAPGHGCTEQNTAFVESVLNIADEALYQAKESGRNCLVVAPYHPGRQAIMCKE
ncbi:MAG: hypothetical protein DELT_00162 [Desulfovibrio sp.]